MQIEKITVDMGDGTKLELTPGQARELRDTLTDVLGDKTTTIPAPMYFFRPLEWQWNEPTWYSGHTVVTCKASGA
jgi:hypothetical protein